MPGPYRTPEKPEEDPPEPPDEREKNYDWWIPVVIYPLLVLYMVTAMLFSMDCGRACRRHDGAPDRRHIGGG